ncbi:PepSY domain-containing protein [Denitromonas iodatirespirans]|uniref:Sulfite reductase flavoprotein subunit alpha n=1 Tax=Denitromonas iodatirespirans TaxID=2795389 RepID=A0A944DCL3_DENI1|nr:sulfite reductase flavoprotein subunit alpha [Denitromonas iodatirespirans]MBT0962611.1 sulfite reductase flavoprotein subunit alpha [Denitromonas iodatirespirans]
MLRIVWFQLHWLLGISAGVVLAVVGASGALISFEDEILRLINPGVLRIEAAGRAPLSLEALGAAAEARMPGRRITALTRAADPSAPARVTYTATDEDAPGRGGRRRGPTRYLDPYSGELLAEPAGREFFRTVVDLHRRLLADDAGKQVVGASTLALLVLTLSGLYLRWPRRVGDWRAWLTFNPRLRGRSLLWDLHAAAGTWALLFYLLTALTGLYWSYGWYRDLLFAAAGVEPPRRDRPAAEAPADIDLAATWQRAEAAAGPWREATLRLTGDRAEFVWLRPDAPHDRARNTLRLRSDGRIDGTEHYADKPLAERMLGSMLPLHTGAWFGLPGRLLVMLASLAMPLFAVTGWLLYLDRRRKQRARRAAQRDAGALPAGTTTAPVLVAYASQSGTAERLAWHSAAQLRAAGISVTVSTLAALDGAKLAGYGRALFAVATFGDGEPPDSARGFARRVLGGDTQADLSGLRYGLLALGDRQFARFCGFAHELVGWLQGRGAHALFAPVEVDGEDAAALDAWQHRLAALTGGPVQALPDDVPFAPWRLAARHELNPGSLGLPVFHLELRPADGALPDWQAGDIAELRVAGETPRSYTIASIREDGSLQLVVRQVRHPDGRLGAGSGRLTAQAALGETVELRIRRNPAFHAPATDTPLILIGNGTGIAGLRAHLHQRARHGGAGAWLIFGERSAAHDFHFAAQIRAWRETGVLERVDTVFSRDGGQTRYVQHRLAESGEALQAWLARGATIMVCGSAEGMAPGVDAALEALIGRAALDTLADQGRYRRDVY